MIWCESVCPEFQMDYKRGVLSHHLKYLLGYSPHQYTVNHDA